MFRQDYRLRRGSLAVYAVLLALAVALMVFLAPNDAPQSPHEPEYMEVTLLSEGNGEKSLPLP